MSKQGFKRCGPGRALRRIATEAKQGTLVIHSAGGDCSQEAEDVCAPHGGCVLEGETVILCEDGETFIKAS